MEIKVFGPGCARCMETEKIVRDVAASKGIHINLKKVSDYKEMMEAGIMTTPAVMVDGVVKSKGKVPTKEEVTNWIDGVASSSVSTTSDGCSCGGEKC